MVYGIIIDNLINIFCCWIYFVKTGI